MVKIMGKYLYQRTIKKKIVMEGIGIHTGKHCSVTLKPAKEDTGLIFIINGDDEKKFLFKVCPENVVDTTNQISLGNGPYRILLVEHLLSALHGMNITNCIIETGSPEVPGMDGSAYDFVKAIADIGVVEQNKKQEVLCIPYPVWFVEEGRHLIALPDDTDFSINCTVSFPYPSIGTQNYHFSANKTDYAEDISKARTFGFIEDHQKLKDRGICLGSSFDNTLALSRDRILSAEVRYENEVARHKVLDIIGDMYLLGMPIRGYISANKSNHLLDYKVITKLSEILLNRPSQKEIKEQYNKFDVVVSSKLKSL